jgi:LytS/YehU family sensor histidine kinase
LGIFIVLWIGIGHFLSDDFCSQRNPGATRTVIAIVVFLVIATPMMIVLATLIVFAPEFIYFWPIVALFGLPMLALSICFAIL